MKKIIAILLLSVAFVACKKDELPPVGGSGASLHANLTGVWDVVSISYSGLANLPEPYDTNTILPFVGEGENVVGWYKFDTIPEPDSVSFDIVFSGKLVYNGALTVTLPVTERGFGHYTVDEVNSTIEGTSYAVQPSGDTTETHMEWDVEENSATRQKWTTKRDVDFYNDPSKLVSVLMVTILEKR